MRPEMDSAATLEKVSLISCWIVVAPVFVIFGAITEALKEFNTRKGKSLTLGGTLVETPEGMEVDEAEINGWEEVKGDDVNADL